MNEESSINPPLEGDKPDTDLVSLITKMQKQLRLLEEKVDLLISLSEEKQPLEVRHPQDRPFAKRSFSKSYRSHEHTNRHEKGTRERSPRERDSSVGHFYERRPQERSRRSNPRNKSYAFKRKDRE